MKIIKDSIYTKENERNTPRKKNLFEPTAEDSKAWAPRPFVIYIATIGNETTNSFDDVQRISSQVENAYFTEI